MPFAEPLHNQNFPLQIHPCLTINTLDAPEASMPSPRRNPCKPMALVAGHGKVPLSSEMLQH